MNDQILKFFEFIYDRQLIYYKKEVLKQPSPWSDDKVFQLYKSCNVYRELDRGSKYIINTICKTGLSDDTKLFNIIAYRFFNLDQTFDGRVFNTILFHRGFNFERLDAELTEKSKTQSIWNNTYLVLPAIWDKNIPNRKHTQVLWMLKWLSERMDEFLWDFKSKKTAEDQILKLREIPLVGPFLAGQIMLDLGYAKVTKFSSNDWCTIGPGSWKGLKIIFGEDSINDSNWLNRIKYLAMIQFEMFSFLKDVKRKDWWAINNKDPFFKSDFLSLMDIQNSLCEFRKYHYLSQGKGKKRYYHERK